MLATARVTIVRLYGGLNNCKKMHKLLFLGLTIAFNCLIYAGNECVFACSLLSKTVGDKGFSRNLNILRRLSEFDFFNNLFLLGQIWVPCFPCKREVWVW